MLPLCKKAENMKLDDDLHGSATFLCLQLRKVLEHNASCKSDLLNISNINTQRWELLQNRNIVENIEISLYVNLNIKLKNKL